jgi:lipopolysaccharide biosynthesis glycosyltransferase
MPIRDEAVVMTIVCAVDRGYLRHCAAMLHSLRESNPDEELTVFVVHDTLDPEEKARFIAYTSAFLPSISLLQADASRLEGFPVSGHGSLAAYFRLLLPDLLPAGVSRFLFIDSDAVVVDSLRPLWEQPLAGHALAAVPEHQLSCADHGYVFGEYFNSGMMLVDLDQWRRSDLLETGRAFARANPHRLRHWDQDVLNHLFAGAWLAMPERWNACPHLFGLNAFYDMSRDKLTAAQRESIDHPAIIHFAGPGPVKPWHYRCEHPWRDTYRRHIADTPWAKVPLQDQPPPWPIRAWREGLFQVKCKLKSLLGS